MSTLSFKKGRCRAAVRRVFQRGRTACRRLGADHRGGVAVFMAISLIPILGLMGVATDTARAYIVKSRLSSAVDAASLAGGQIFFSAHRDDDIRMFFDANFPSGYLGASVDGPNIVADEAHEKVAVTATATVPTTFMRLFGYDDVDVYAAAEVTRKMQALDVVLSIDISGSMNSAAPGGGRRIDAAKTAAYELIDILFGADGTKDISVELQGQRHDRGEGVQRKPDEKRNRRLVPQPGEQQHRPEQAVVRQQLAGAAADSAAGGLARLRLLPLHPQRDGRRRRRHPLRRLCRRRHQLAGLAADLPRKSPEVGRRAGGRVEAELQAVHRE
ncbi:MAG: hypothetical protein JNM75_12550 [Rhodospirillales bacterium]|nr:hypothetical protein [Rhodospirillales bacterium]